MKHQFFQAVVAMACIGLGVASGCSEEKPFDITLVTSPELLQGLCPDYDTGALVKGDQPGAVDLVRITFFEVAEQNSSDNFLCDRLLAADQTGRPYYIRAAKDTELFISVEAFDVNMNLVASGQLDRVRFNQRGDAHQIFLPLTGRMGCTLGVMSKARAFHTTTALPGNRALVAGGVVASAGYSTEVNPTDGLYLTDSLEIYDGNAGDFVGLAFSEPEDATGVARAFHSAFLLPGSDADQAHVLLLGGIGRAVPEQNSPMVFMRDNNQAFRWYVSPDARPAPTEMVTIDFTSQTPTITRSTEGLEGWSARFFQGAVSYDATENIAPLVTGGATSMVEDVTNNVFKALLDSTIERGDDEGTGGLQTSGQLNTPRAGHTVTALDPSRLLAWGGNLGQGVIPEDLLSTLGEVIALSTLDASRVTFASISCLANAVSPAPSTAFHTATLLQDGSVLITGGFLVEGNIAIHANEVWPVTRIVPAQSGSNGWCVYGAQNTELDFTPVGYHAAVRLPDGSVLITGGSPLAGSSETCDATTTWQCSTRQAVIFEPSANPSDLGEMHPLPNDVGEEGLEVSRFGHTMVSLDSGIVLVVGGMRWDGDKLWTEPSAEVYNPATGSATEDPLGRAPGELLMDVEGEPISECREF